MRFTMNAVSKALIAGSAASLLAACGGGGGGGSSGGPDVVNEYAISMRADRASLPINVNGEFPGIGANAPYTTPVYVTAKRKNTNDPIPGGTFACNVIPAGLENGALAYLDGEHTTTVEINGEEFEVEELFRSVTLESNAGGASFHFHAGDTAGTATITCAINDPQSGKQVTTSLNIQVGAATGKPSELVINRSGRPYAWIQGINQPTQVIMQAQVLDEAGQRVPDPAPGVNNLYARIVTDGSSAADDAAVLRAAGVTSKAVKARSVNGQAEFAAISGNAPGTLLIEFMTDRADNNVDNGITELVSNFVSVPVVVATGQSALTITEDVALPDAAEGVPYATILDAEGGLPPYTWSLAAGTRLPSGLKLSPDGVISGTPSEPADNFRFVLRVTDSGSPVAQVAMQEFSINIEAEPEPEPVPTAPVIQSATLPAGTVGQAYLAIASASGGSAPFSWAANPATFASGLQISGTGIVSGTPTVAGTYQVALTVSNGDGLSTTRIVSIQVNDPAP